jgi:hypothetical protein
MVLSYDHLQAEILWSDRLAGYPEGGHKTETCSGHWIKYSIQCCVRRKPWSWPSTRNRMQTTNFKMYACWWNKCYPSCHTWLLSLLITGGRHWVPLSMSHSPNAHTNLLNVFIKIANNKGILYYYIIKRKLTSILKTLLLTQKESFKQPYSWTYVSLLSSARWFYFMYYQLSTFVYTCMLCYYARKSTRKRINWHIASKTFWMYYCHANTDPIRTLRKPYNTDMLQI